MILVYCDTGAYRPELGEYERRGLIRLHQFKYENRNRRIAATAPPTNPTWKQMNYTWAELKADSLLNRLSWDDLAELSPRFREIIAVIGTNNLTDAQHIDSAFRAGCKIFLTSDKGDIHSRSKDILSITGMRVLHPIEDWDAFGLAVSAHQAPQT